ncbi:phosphatidylinositol N-acetylglucosaminyltransferase subunit gpi1 [Serendipita sp. 401]|nr:phosphatidylinositol N-acetylglucosaminyltransferase subunit gpi1 [Serendipita sp. 401]KAG8839723.1 phosphatidylinositol N-acetylglucosaminyltransferase subunit gpi1 [Serendipita sp. 400]KAG9057473.1 phosphatidylinositol N-acetylglucosaminyltransferase subunit gpi1 [Serendipita sp. 407]
MRNLRVFWPQEVSSVGFVIGWLHEDSIVVADVVEDKDPHTLLRDSLIDNEKWLELEPSCHNAPGILGQSVAEGEGVRLRWSDDITTGTQFSTVYYKRPSLYHMRFYSVSSLNLDITISEHEKILIGDSKDTLRCDAIFETLRPIPKSSHLLSIVCQLNASGIIAEALQRKAPSNQRPTSRHKVALPRLPVVVRQCMRWLVESSIRICGLSASLFDSTIRLKDVSATVQQVDVRLEQFSFFPSQIALISTRSRRDIATFSAQYINFFNNAWLIFNDVVVGIAVGAILSENHVYFGKLLYTYTELWTIEHLITALRWLDDWPVGLKLNTNLSRALSLSFITLTTIWSRLLRPLGPHFPHLVYFLGISGWSGLTMILSLSSDMVSLLTIHIYLSYLAATTVCRRIIITAGSLWNLFRGKRYNVLQQRLDSWDYSLDQLLLGTMLFTLVTFLSPTIVVYYALFSGARLAVIMMHAGLETLLAFMNHFPLFVLMLRVKDSQRLPGGIILIPGRRDHESRAVNLKLENTPIPFSGIFFQHLLLWGRVSSHYHPIRLLRHVASATIINPIPRYSIRYSMLPIGSFGTKRAEKIKTS